MPSKESSQKFIGRNRAPRVQIEYELEAGEKKVQLPFVIGVMADLSGKPSEALPSLAEREFENIDMENFDNVLKRAKPRVAFTVPNTLSNEGNIAVDITFEDMEDFSPGKVAQKVEALRNLLDVRTQLADLKDRMDGKSGAEKLITELLKNDALLKSLAASAKPEGDTQR